MLIETTRRYRVKGFENVLKLINEADISKVSSIHIGKSWNVKDKYYLAIEENEENEEKDGKEEDGDS